MSELLVFPRGKDRDDPDRERLQLEVKEYNGNRYIDCRITYRSEADGTFLPTKRGITIRARELQDVIAWLMDAEKALGGPAEGKSNREGGERQARRPLNHQPRTEPPASGPDDLEIF